MRREGRQHGMVRTHAILNPNASGGVPLPPNMVDAPPPTRCGGAFTKVPSKPTNHSKSTASARCSRSKSRYAACHPTPASKSKSKAKGAGKFRRTSPDVEGDFNVVDSDLSSYHHHDDDDIDEA